MEHTTPSAPIQRMLRDIFIGRRGHPSLAKEGTGFNYRHFSSAARLFQQQCGSPIIRVNPGWFLILGWRERKTRACPEFLF
jgi:hypothetical protein